MPNIAKIGVRVSENSVRERVALFKSKRSANCRRSMQV